MSVAAAPPSTLVSPQWVKDHLSDPSIKLLDASWYMPIHKRDAKAEFLKERIPNAAFFEIDLICAKDTPLPHMLPSELEFGVAMDALGVSNDSTVIVFDRMGTFAASRGWYTLRAFGHKNVAVMEGGYPAWTKISGPVDTRELSPQDAFGKVEGALKNRAALPTPKYQAKLNRGMVRSMDEMVANITSKKEQVIDARSAGRFWGTEPEPRQGLKGGHIPGALSVPFPSVLTPEGTMRSKEELVKVFEAAGLDLSKPVVGSCGSGLTACVLTLALSRCGVMDAPVYDGSWSEYGLLELNVPVASKN